MKTRAKLLLGFGIVTVLLIVVGVMPALEINASEDGPRRRFSLVWHFFCVAAVQICRSGDVLKF